MGLAFPVLQTCPNPSAGPRYAFKLTFWPHIFYIPSRQSHFCSLAVLAISPKQGAVELTGTWKVF